MPAVLGREAPADGVAFRHGVGVLGSARVPLPIVPDAGDAAGERRGQGLGAVELDDGPGLGRLDLLQFGGGGVEDLLPIAGLGGVAVAGGGLDLAVSLGEPGLQGVEIRACTASATRSVAGLAVFWGCLHGRAFRVRGCGWRQGDVDFQG